MHGKTRHEIAIDIFEHALRARRADQPRRQIEIEHRIDDRRLARRRIDDDVRPRAALGVMKAAHDGRVAHGA